tara:strand:+ start:325 stop:666 length:342 start_codon:yes stop_codon:yes gene_type:complete
MPTPFMCHWCDKPTMNETGICIECEQKYEEGNKDIAASIRELEIGIAFYKEGLQKVQDKIANDGLNYVDIKEVLNITVAYLDGEPTTADEHNVVYLSDINKEIAKEWKNKKDV